MRHSKLRDMLARFDLSLRQLYIMYICVFCLPLLLSLLLSNNSINQLENQIEKTGLSMAHQMQSVVDSRMDDIKVLIDQLNNHSTVRYLLNRSGELSSADRYKYLTIIHDLRKQYASINMVEDVLIYMKNTDSVISTVSRSDSRFFYENYYSYEGIFYDDWLSRYMHGAHDMTVIPARNVFNGVSTKRLITVLQALPRDSGPYQTGMAVFFIDEKWLLSQLMPDSKYDRDVFVFSDTGELIVSSGDDSGADIDLERVTAAEGSYSATIGGRSMHVAYVKSPALGWTYMLALPVDQFFSQAIELRSLTVSALVVVGLIGIALTVLLAYISFIPASTALHALGRSGAESSAEHVHRSISMRDLGSFLQEAIDDRDMYQKRLPYLIENYVFKLLNGSREVESELSLVSEVLGFRFPTNQFAVLCLKLDPDADTHEKLQSVLDSISGLPDCGMAMYGTVTAQDTGAVLVSFWAGRSEEYRELLYRAADRLQRCLGNSGGRPRDIGVSLVADKYEEISALYRQAVMCLAGRSAPDGGHIVFYADIARLVPPGDYSYSLKEEKNLIAYVCAGDSLRMNRLLDEVFAAHEQEARMVAGMTQCLKYDMIGTLFRCAQEINRDSEYERGTWEMIQELMGLEQPDAIYAGMRRAFTVLCDRAYSTRSSHNDDMRDRMIAYLAENYADPDMGLDMAARAFGIAPGYLSRFFKEQTGGNFVDHINRLRVERAAQLLRTTDMPFADVAEQCGLAGSQALNRLFNRVLGVSPTAYRQLAQQGKLNIDA